MMMTSFSATWSWMNKGKEQREKTKDCAVLYCTVTVTATFDIEKMISFIIQSNTWLKCLLSFQGKMSLIFQMDRRRLWLFPIMQSIFFMASEDKNMNHPTGFFNYNIILGIINQTNSERLRFTFNLSASQHCFSDNRILKLLHPRTAGVLDSFDFTGLFYTA